MFEAPDVQNARIEECLEAEYGLATTEVDFLQLGADVNSAVYRVVAAGGECYFLKLRRGDFPAETVTIPHWLSAMGMELVLSPIATRTGALWTELNGLAVVLYPFVAGRSGWEVELSPSQWKALGSAMKTLHAAALAPSHWERGNRAPQGPALSGRGNASGPVCCCASFQVPYNREKCAVLEGFGMTTDITKLTIRLPRRDVEFAKSYAKAHGLTVTEVIDRYLRRMRAIEEQAPSPELDFIIGLVPADVNAQDEYRQHLENKHG